MNDNNPFKVNKNNTFIYYILNTDSSKNEELAKENIFNLDIKKINKDKLKYKSERLKLFDEFFNYKLKKIKMRNKPTPFQKFLKEKKQLRTMNNLKIQNNINSINIKLDILSDILSKNNKNKNLSYNKNNNESNKIIKFPLKRLSSTLYLNKISNYKKNNKFYYSGKKDLYYYYKKSDKNKIKSFKSYKSEKKFKSSKKRKILELITNNDLNSKYFLQKPINNNNKFESKRKEKKNNYTNTNINDSPFSTLSIIKNRNQQFNSYRNVNSYSNFPNINKNTFE